MAEKRAVMSKVETLVCVGMTLLSTLSLLITYYAASHGGVEKLAPYDLNADPCGGVAVGGDRVFLYYPELGNMALAVCVSECPGVETNKTVKLPNGKGGVRDHRFSPSQLVIGEYCLPERVNATDFVSSTQLQTDVVHGVFRDIAKSTEFLFAFAFVCVFSCFGWLKVLYLARSLRVVSFLLVDCLPFVSSAIFIVSASFTLQASPFTKATAVWVVVTGFLIKLPVTFGMLRYLVTSSYERGRSLTLAGIQALFEMPDLVTALIATMLFSGVLVIWNAWMCAAVLTIGRPVPKPLTSDAGEIIGVETDFLAPAWRPVALGVVILSHLLQTETS
ncbi:hypothetical protein TGARI_209585 [Toxoplasma gondii ARI]|uniref:Transmembrane protein n=1 Tax=Toxoplasma gondii ARI TaxID=1074872 RepID=A0A139XR63_TOXGO|nr:hypothetical protein TGARI_209585 [Toxoplasma gondii ARI]